MESSKIYSNGKRLEIYNDSYINDEGNYNAIAKDDAGALYLVTWEAYENAAEIIEECDMCDWSKYSVEIIEEAP